MKQRRIIAVDVGNSSTKFGLFETCDSTMPVAFWIDDPCHLDKHSTLLLHNNAVSLRSGHATTEYQSKSEDKYEPDRECECECLTRSKRQPFQNHWVISSVHPTRLENTVARITQHYPDDSVVLLKHDDIPFKSNVFSREKLGIDRLIAAYAGWKWVKTTLPEFSQRPVLVADFGTAITIDLVSPNGCFEGGAIYPGFGLSAQSLQKGTAQLPEIDLDSLGLLSYPGRNTESAIGVAILWSVVGLIRQIAEQVEVDYKTGVESDELLSSEFATHFSTESSNVSSTGRATRFSTQSTNDFSTEKTKGASPVLILTGGGAATVFPLLKPYFPENQLHFLPHLLLSGIALTQKKKWDADS
ncbi:MAG: type III pantothenate kinase [Thermoguttaceae bacterium]